MSRLAAAAMLAVLACSGPAWAQAKGTWTYFPIMNGAYGWSSGDIVDDRVSANRTIWTFMLSREPKLAGDREYLWMFEELRYDCTAKTVEFVSGAFVDKDRQVVANAKAEKPVPVRPGKPEEIGLLLVCENRPFVNQVTVTDLTAAMDGASALLKKPS